MPGCSQDWVAFQTCVVAARGGRRSRHSWSVPDMLCYGGLVALCQESSDVTLSKLSFCTVRYRLFRVLAQPSRMRSRTRSRTLSRTRSPRRSRLSAQRRSPHRCTSAVLYAPRPTLYLPTPCFVLQISRYALLSQCHGTFGTSGKAVAIMVADVGEDPMNPSVGPHIVREHRLGCLIKCCCGDMHMSCGIDGSAAVSARHPTSPRGCDACSPRARSCAASPAPTSVALRARRILSV